MAPILAYWDMRGIIAPIRMILAYADLRYEYKVYPLDNTDEWYAEDKVQLGETLDFPNLPYYIDGKVQLSQTKTIVAYLGRKHGLDAKDETEAVRVSLIMDQSADMWSIINQIGYLTHSISNRVEVYETLRKQYVESIPNRLERIAKFLGQNKWIAGDHLTYADFYLYDILDVHRLLFNRKHLNAFPTLVTYIEQIEELKGVKEFLLQMDRMPTHTPGYALLGNSKDYKPSDD